MRQAWPPSPALVTVKTRSLSRLDCVSSSGTWAPPRTAAHGTCDPGQQECRERRVVTVVLLDILFLDVTLPRLTHRACTVCQHRTHGAGQSQRCHCSVRVVVRPQGTLALCRPSQNTHVTLISASGPVPSGLHTRLWHQQTACPFCLQSSGWSPCFPEDTDLGNPWLRRKHSGGNTERQRRNRPTSTDVPEPG